MNECCLRNEDIAINMSLTLLSIFSVTYKSFKTCSEAVWGDLGIEPLNLRRNKRKVVWFSRLLKKGKDSFCRKVFEKEWNKYKIPGRKKKTVEEMCFRYYK